MLVYASSLQQNEIESFNFSSLVYPLGMIVALVIALTVVMYRRPT